MQLFAIPTLATYFRPSRFAGKMSQCDIFYSAIATKYICQFTSLGSRKFYTVPDIVFCHTYLA